MTDLERYGRHGTGCDAARTLMPRNCTCGLAEAIEREKQAQEDRENAVAIAHEEQGNTIRAERELAEARAQLAQAREVMELFAITAEAAVAHHENKGKGGQQVAFVDDFAHLSPSTAIRLRWWARQFRAALEGRKP